MANATAVKTGSAWDGGKLPYKASYGKLMMWFFLISDAFTFSTLLVVYGFIRFSSEAAWANPEEVFTHFPVVTEIFHIHPPLAFVGLMTFILIASSVTMVLAVEAGHRMDKKQVKFYMVLTIIGGAAFVLCQAYEWYNFINGTEFGALHLADGSVLTVAAIDGHGIPTDLSYFDSNGVEQHILGAAALEKYHTMTEWVKGANLVVNQYSQNPSFAGLFFFITGFHGSHVASGVVINYIIYRQVHHGVMEGRGHYEMVEKVGLYWHFVDLVWVFVFTFFYLL